MGAGAGPSAPRWGGRVVGWRAAGRREGRPAGRRGACRPGSRRLRQCRDHRPGPGGVHPGAVARYEGEERAKLVRGGLATAVSVGVLAGVVLLAVWLLRPRGGKIDLQDLV